MADNLLEARRCAKSSAAWSRVNDVDFDVPRGSIVSLIGPNGAGKTTFFNMLTGVYTPTSGEILFDGRDVAGLPPHAVTHLGVGRTFQNIRLFPTMTSLENVLVGMHSRIKGGIVRSVLRTPGSAPGGARGAPSARMSYCATASCRRPRTTPTRCTSPMATSAGSRSRGRSAPTPSCSCSTSRRRA